MISSAYFRDSFLINIFCCIGLSSFKSLQLLREILSCCAQTLISLFTNTCHWTLLWDNEIQSLSPPCPTWCICVSLILTCAQGFLNHSIFQPKLCTQCTFVPLYSICPVHHILLILFALKIPLNIYTYQFPPPWVWYDNSFISNCVFVGVALSNSSKS